MKITIQCRCEAKFMITPTCKNQGSFICQNCSRPLPGKMSDTIKDMLNSYINLAKDVRDAELYEVTFSEAKI